MNTITLIVTPLLSGDSPIKSSSSIQYFRVVNAQFMIVLTIMTISRWKNSCQLIAMLNEFFIINVQELRLDAKLIVSVHELAPLMSRNLMTSYFNQIFYYSASAHAQIK